MKKKTTVTILIILTALIILVPLFLIRGAQFEGSDGSGSDMVDEITDGEYEPWFEPVLETLIGGELPGEMETLFFCIQTGIGVGIIAFSFGYLAARKKYGGIGDQKQETGRKIAVQES
jgi:cobalt/nickel transport protein